MSWVKKSYKGVKQKNPPSVLCGTLPTPKPAVNPSFFWSGVMVLVKFLVFFLDQCTVTLQSKRAPEISPNIPKYFTFFSTNCAFFSDTPSPLFSKKIKQLHKKKKPFQPPFPALPIKANLIQILTQNLVAILNATTKFLRLG